MNPLERTPAAELNVGGSIYHGRLALQQRVLPSYRAPFFNLLAEECQQGLSVFAGEPRADEMIHNASDLTAAEWVRADNIHLLRGDMYLLWQRGILRWLDSVDPDVLILEANPRYLSNRLAISWMRKRKRPLIGWALGAPAVKGALASVRELMRTRYLFQFNALIAYSTQGAAEYEALGFPKERIFTAYNAVSPVPESMPHRQSFHGREPRILFVGRLQQRKRVDLLLEACAQLDQGVELVVVGDGPVRAQLEAQAAEVYPQAQFVGSAYGESLKTWLEWADLFVLPGTGGLAVQQAMASGLPVVVAEGDGTQVDLVTGGNGWLVPPTDLDQLVQSLTRALQDPELLLTMGRKSYELSVGRFNIKAMATVFFEAIESVQKA